MNTQFSNDSNSILSEAIIAHMHQSHQQRLTFAEYMDLVLYHPQHGYYTTKAIDIGPRGDFFTSPHLAADFGELLAEQFVQMWEIFGRAPFTLVELGAGQGILAADILKYLSQQHPDFFAVLEYVIVERSAALKKEQQQRLQDFLPAAKDQQRFSLKWCNLAEIPAASITGCCFANELVDALPVHQFMIDNGQLQEIYVTKIENDFKEITDAPSTPLLAKYFELLKIDMPSSVYADGYRSEVNLAALDWLSAIANRLRQGYLLTIDYGYSASRYYSPFRKQGTLQCYYQHLRHDNPYIHIGRQDITAHVNFTALEVWGKLYGLEPVAFTQQGLFLMALGLGNRIADLSTGKVKIQVADLLKRRDALHQLIDPTGLGGFGVLVQSKGLSKAQAAQPLKGLMTLF